MTPAANAAPYNKKKGKYLRLAYFFPFFLSASIAEVNAHNIICPQARECMNVYIGIFINIVRFLQEIPRRHFQFSCLFLDEKKTIDEIILSNKQPRNSELVCVKQKLKRTIRDAIIISMHAHVNIAHWDFSIIILGLCNIFFIVLY